MSKKILIWSRRIFSLVGIGALAYMHGRATLGIVGYRIEAYVLILVMIAFYLINFCMAEGFIELCSRTMRLVFGFLKAIALIGPTAGLFFTPELHLVPTRQIHVSEILVSCGGIIGIEVILKVIYNLKIKE